jgi:hypothetical protein
MREILCTRPKGQISPSKAAQVRHLVQRRKQRVCFKARELLNQIVYEIVSASDRIL